MVSKPFESTNNPLETGIHLHWTLPKEFRQAKISDTNTEPAENDSKAKTEYRIVPNHWIIERQTYQAGKTATGKNKNGEDKLIKTRKWLIKSDALMTQKEHGSRAFPVENSDEQKHLPNYRYLGKLYDDYEELAKKSAELKKMESQIEILSNSIKEREEKLKTLSPNTPEAITLKEATKTSQKFLDNILSQKAELLKNFSNKEEYVEQLTAFGYGEPLFSAYYPECRNVSGFYDDLSYYLDDSDDLENEKPIKRHINKNLSGETYEFRYIIAGCYDNSSNDPLSEADFKVWTHPHLSKIDKTNDSAYPKGLEKFEAITKDGQPLISYGLLPEIRDKNSDRIEEFFWFVKTPNSFKENWDKYNTNGEEIPGSFDSELSKSMRGQSVLIGAIKNIAWGGKDDASVSLQADNKKDETKVVLGNSPGQALAALLGASVDENKQHGTEMMLDAIQAGLFEDEKKQDFPARLEAGLHEGVFNAVAGESYWTIRFESKENAAEMRQKNAQNSVPFDKYKIPDTLIESLRELNKLKIETDRNFFVFKDRKRQLYADWYKYMLMEYDFSLNEITTEAHVNYVREYLTGELVEADSETDIQKENLEKISRNLTEIRRLLNELNSQYPDSDKHYQLLNTPAARYWEPKEPVILLHGDDIVPSEKYRKRTDRLEVQLYAVSPSQDPLDSIEAVLLSLSDEANTDKPKIVYQDGSVEKWNPLFMDWEVDVFPFTKPGDTDFHQRDWSADSIVAHYDLHPGEVDLRLQNSVGDVSNRDELFGKWTENHPDVQIQGGKRIQSIEGRSILTSGAHLPMVENLKKLLEDDKSAEKGGELLAVLNDISLLSQNISGFNDALLMRKQILQLNVKDPLADSNVLKNFTETLEEFIADSNDFAPLLSNLFLPIREGAFKIRKLRLVDMWGRTRELKLAELEAEGRVIVAEAMKPPETLNTKTENLRGTAYFPPRIIQPAKLNFSWLSTNPNNPDVDNFGLDSPICGFVVPNFLDNSLHIFNSDGEGLGVIARSSEKIVWNPFPGNAASSEISDITDRTLKQFVESICQFKTDFLSVFLKTAKNSFGSTLTENYAQFDGMAFLVGRPLALVRSKLELQLRGQPAINNSWDARETEYLKSEHHVAPSMGFDKLRFAVRLGDKFKAGDGLFSYYIEPDEENHIKEFYSPYAAEGEINPEQYWYQYGLEKMLWVFLRIDWRNAFKKK